MFVVRQYEGYEIRKNVEWVKVLMWGNEECVNVYRGANECKGVTGRAYMYMYTTTVPVRC